MRRRWTLALVLAAATATACGGEESGPSTAPSDAPHVPEFSRAVSEAPIRFESRAGHVTFPVTTDSHKAQAWFEQGVAFLYAYQWIFAARSFNAALSEDPGLAMAHVGLARAWTGAQDYERAEAHLEAAEAAASDRAVTEKERRWIALARMQHDGARLDGDARTAAHRRYRSAIDELIALDPEDPEAWVLRGNAQEGAIWGRGQGGGEDAIDYYVAALRLAPDHPGAHHFLVHTYENLGRLDEAAVHGQALTKLAAGAPHPLHMYAHVLPRLGRWQEAREWLAEADRLHRRSLATEEVGAADDWHYAHNLHLLGLVELAMGDEQAGAAHLRDAYGVEGRGAFAGFHRGPWIEYLLWAGRFEDALAEAKATEALGFPMARVIGAALGGEAALASGDVTGARRSLVRALSATKSIGEPEHGNLFELVLPYVAGRYTSHLELLLELADGDSTTASDRLLEAARETMRSRSIDVWAGGRMRVETTAAHAERLGDVELATQLADVAAR
jgi:tetratricopeptide (TPR) repeat protein